MQTTSQPAKPLAPLAAVKDGLEKMRPQFVATLPSHIAPEKFERVVLTAINTDPDLLNADRHSLFLACLRAAQDGLLPDKREGALVIFKDRNGRKLVTWMPMKYGLLKKIRQSGEIDSIGARIVYQKEIESPGVDKNGVPLPPRFRFVIDEGSEKLYHDPMLWGDRGEKVLVYAYARFKETGTVKYAPLHKDDVLKRRNVSRARDRDGKITGPWKDWESEMWEKTAIRAIAKELPLSADVLETIHRPDTPTEFDRLKSAAVAALGAPVGEEPEALTYEPEPESETTVEPLADDHNFVQEFIAKAITLLGSGSLKTEQDLVEYKQSVLETVDEENPPADLKAKLLNEFNVAYLERLRAFNKAAR